MGVTEFPCLHSPTHVWRAHWHGPETEMVLQFTGRMMFEAAGLALEQQGYEQSLHLRMPADTDVTVALGTGDQVGPHIALLERSPGGLRVPGWDRFTPVWRSETTPADDGLPGSVQ
jgi:hypothetical protein